MRTPEDALRSLARYASLALGDEWEVTYGSDDGTFKRPFARVGMSIPAQYPVTGRSRFVYDVIQPFFIHAYPAKAATSEQSVVDALRAKNALEVAFNVGIEQGHPLRVPLYDYEGTTIDEGSIQRNHCDYMRLTDLSLNHLPDPDDRTMWVVVADLRATWRRTAQPKSTGRTAADVTIVPTTPE